MIVNREKRMVKGEGKGRGGRTSISVISTPSRSQVTMDFSPLATQSKSTDSPSITVLLTGGTASKVSPGTDVGNGDAPGLNDLTSLPSFRLVKRQRDYCIIRVSLIFFFCFFFLVLPALKAGLYIIHYLSSRLINLISQCYFFLLLMLFRNFDAWARRHDCDLFFFSLFLERRNERTFVISSLLFFLFFLRKEGARHGANNCAAMTQFPINA